MGATGTTLTPLEVAVAGGGAALPRLQPVVVHGQTHGAAGQTPLKACLDEDLVQPLGLGLGLHLLGARHHQGLYPCGDLATAGDGGSRAQILDAAVGARTDEHLVDGHVGELLARLQVHVGEGLAGGLLLHRIGEGFRCRDGLIDGNHLARVGAPGHLRGDVGGVQHHFGVEVGTFVALEGQPVGDGLFQRLPLGSELLATDVVDGGLVGGNHTRFGAELDGHVAHRHAPFHGEPLDGFTGELHHVAGPACMTHLADDGEHHVFGADACGQLAVDRDTHGPGAALFQGLGGHHVFHFGGADTERERPEGTVGGGV